VRCCSLLRLLVVALIAAVRVTFGCSLVLPLRCRLLRWLVGCCRFTGYVAPVCVTPVRSCLIARRLVPLMLVRPLLLPRWTCFAVFPLVDSGSTRCCWLPLLLPLLLLLPHVDSVTVAVRSTFVGLFVRYRFGWLLPTYAVVGLRWLFVTFALLRWLRPHTRSTGDVVARFGGYGDYHPRLFCLIVPARVG